MGYDKTLGIVSLLEKNNFRIADMRGSFGILELKAKGKRNVNVEVKKEDSHIFVWIPNNIYHPSIDGDSLMSQKKNMLEKGYQNAILEYIATEKRLRRFSEFDPNNHIKQFFGVRVGTGNEITIKEANLVQKVSDAAIEYHCAINSLRYEKTLKFYIGTTDKYTDIAVRELLVVVRGAVK